MWLIDKTFDFCYGHRVWSQTLNPDFSLDSCLKCRHLHGHQGQVKIFLQSNSLTDGMVTDFKHLNWFKKWLDDTLDHKFIMDVSDPLLKTLFPIYSLFITVVDPLSGCLVFDTKAKKTLSGELEELYEGLVLVNFVPTSENLSKWLLETVQIKMKEIGVEAIRLEFNETPKSRSTYQVD